MSCLYGELGLKSARIERPWYSIIVLAEKAYSLCLGVVQKAVLLAREVKTSRELAEACGIKTVY